MRSTRLDERIRELERKAALCVNVAAAAELNESTARGRTIARIVRRAMVNGREMTITQAEALANRCEQFLAAIEQLDGYTDDAIST